MQIGEHTYQLELSLHHGQIKTLSTKFMPQGAIAVVTTEEEMEWLRDMVERLWLFKVGENDTCMPPYRGMPLIILALDRGTSNVVGELFLSSHILPSHKHLLYFVPMYTLYIYR